jgi:hypothetical protein
MILLGSVKGRLIALHLIAVLAVCVVLPLALYWRIDAAARGLHERALRDQADEIAQYLRRLPDGTWSLELPEELREQYSADYNRYGFAIIAKSGHVLFSSREHDEPLFTADPRSDRPGYFEHDVGTSHLFGASVPVAVGGETLWIQISEDEKHRDVLIDDIVAEFLPHVAWVIIPILLILVCVDLVIFSRALRPLAEASTLARRISPSADRPPPARSTHAARSGISGFCRQRGIGAAGARLHHPARISR